jgi:hypothetical protein
MVVIFTQDGKIFEGSNARRKSSSVSSSEKHAFCTQWYRSMGAGVAVCG